MSYRVKAGVRSLVVRDGDEWIEKNLRQHVTERETEFTSEELVIHPEQSGCGCFGLTIGDVYAEMNNFGFRRNGWTLIVSAEEVEVIE